MREIGCVTSTPYAMMLKDEIKKAETSFIAEPSEHTKSKLVNLLYALANTYPQGSSSAYYYRCRVQNILSGIARPHKISL